MHTNTELVATWREEAREIRMTAAATYVADAIDACADELAALSSRQGEEWKAGDRVIWTDCDGIYQPTLGTVREQNPDGSFWIDFADGSIASGATPADMHDPATFANSATPPTDAAVLAVVEALAECELFVRTLGLDSEPARLAAENARAALSHPSIAAMRGEVTWKSQKQS